MRELHLFPSAQFLTQALIPAGLRRLALQRAALLLHFKDDVVDARQVSVCGFELQLRLPATRLVLRHPGGLFDQRTALGRT